MCRNRSYSLRRCAFALGVCCAMGVFGCSRGPELGEVEGTVMQAGQPLSNVVVLFSPDPGQGHQGPCSTAVTDAQGRFVLKCETGRPGAVVGRHRISLEDLQVYNLPRDNDGSSADAIKQVLRVPTVYANANQTPLIQEVHAGKQEISVSVQSVAKSP